RKKNRDYQFIINQLEYLEPIKLYCNNSEGQSTKISDVFEIFRRNKDHNFFPVINSKDEPVGLIREKDLKEYVYSKYGKDLLMNRNISKNIFDFIVKCPICEASMKIERLIESYAVEEFPEGIIITQNGRYVGFLSAQAVLKVLNEKNIALARDQNPLTRLPGNILINEYIQQALEDIRNEYILVYFDFNNFKAFNDKYGFRQGDRAILLFADILNKANHLNRFFIGHIGGDDFFAGFKTEDIEFDEILRIIQEITNKFTKNVQSLYDEEDRRRGYIISSDRDGVEKQFPLMDMVSCILHLPINRSINTVEELGLIIADLKKYAKTSGTNIVLFKVKNGYIIDCENFP
ncbi:MAG TPA: diguanylate cyclase, partial [Syntrophorhabdaceae bacterium]|nr:diguanylate cyclase [Syntrophorhabdaceae bacterium]